MFPFKMCNTISGRILNWLSLHNHQHCVVKSVRKFSPFVKDENSSMKYWEQDMQKSNEENAESHSYEDVYQSSYNAHAASKVFAGQKELSHVDGSGRANMVDVGDKEVSKRAATAVASIYIGPEAYKLVSENGLKKGNFLTLEVI